jgi:hypothetical protein
MKRGDESDPSIMALISIVQSANPEWRECAAQCGTLDYNVILLWKS